MSAARECDRCGALFKPVPGCLSLDLLVVIPEKSADGAVMEQGWSEIELCLICSVPVAAHLRCACNNFDDIFAGRPVREAES